MDAQPHRAMVVASNRRTLLKQLLAFGIGAAGAIHSGSASAARRGHAAPDLITGGYIILVSDGDRPGVIDTAVSVSGGGRAIIFANLLSWSDIEVELIQPDAGQSTYVVQSKWSLRVAIDAPGEVRWRIWLPGETPGEFHVLDFQG